MIISIGEARQLMGKAASRKYTDSEVEELVNTLSAIVNLAIDFYIEMKRKRKETRGGELTYGKEVEKN